MAALFDAREHVLTVREIRAEIAREFEVVPDDEPRDGSDDPLAEVPAPQGAREGLGFDASVYARQIFALLTPEELEVLRAVSDADSDSLAQREAAAARALGRDEATIRRRLKSVREKVRKVITTIDTTATVSLKRYFAEVIALVRARE